MNMDQMILNIAGGVILSVLGYFLRSTMDQIKELNKVVGDCKNDLSVLKNDHLNKYDHLTEKFDTLCNSVRDLTKEIKELNKEFKKKD